MPSDRLLLMGLLSRHPLKSTVLKRFVHQDGRFVRNFTDYEKMHMIATWYTPGLSRQWLFDQFEQYGISQETAWNRLKRFVYKPEYVDKWKHLGERNILFIGQPEVERYFTRTRMKSLNIPRWALPIFNDEWKRGMSKAAISRKYGISQNKLGQAMRRSMFDPPTKGNPNWSKRFTVNLKGARP